MNGRIVQNTCILVLFFVVTDGLLSSSEPLVDTKWGPIRGKWSKSNGGRAIANFLGIPYAIPPVGELRFRNPQRWDRAWTTVRNATIDGSSCIQKNRLTDEFSGSEDCLYLNVYVPHISTNQQGTANLSVLVFVHGGAFFGGSSDSHMYAPVYLLDRNVILVTLNYRLNVLGFLSTMNKVAPGNYGLKDVKMALEWIQENIRNFGGNPESVTIMGHSAGSAIVNFLALSNNTEGLFHKYILLSGSVVSSWAVRISKSYKQIGLRMARLVGCLPKRYEDQVMTNKPKTKSIEKTGISFKNISYTEEDDTEMIKCMRKVDAKKLVNMIDEYHVWRKNPWIVFNPVVEDDSEDAIITMNPIKVLEEGRFRSMPAIIQIVRDEGLMKSIEFITNPVIKKETLEDFDNIFSIIVEYRGNPADFNMTAIKEFYFNGTFTSNSVQNLTNLISDYTIIWPVFRLVKYLSKMSNSSIYFSFFCYEGTFSSTFAYNTTYFGVAHGDDLDYLFPNWNYVFRDLKLHNTKADYAMIDVMTEMYANFVIEGTPRASKAPEWPDYREYQRFMRFGIDKSPDIMVQADFLSDRMEFWEKLMADVPETEPIEYLFTDPPPTQNAITLSRDDANSCNKNLFPCVLDRDL
ncbi:esterase E4-like isoform X2 [Pseudomyrmex gracilis]|uniref:esterase E4-like isoform X2 n=1 Tax=Pseudomyrmex gracilis TaxID=219809 RepID=UPI000995323A|nr:esterase E4-like isoform X2 [Pseudomyrmex gracilis]